VKKIVVLGVFVLLLLAARPVPAATVGDCARVEILTAKGLSLPLYPTGTAGAKKKVYAEAVKGDEYTIIVRNLLPRRVGLVVAVDGRNIISGQKSWLRNNERMYVLGPYETGQYRGWRTGSDRVNRFYFTDAPDSYASAFGDESAMGIIAVTVYPEIERVVTPAPQAEHSPEKAGAASPQASEAKKSSPDRATESAGTGYGREEFSPSRVVAFEPEARPAETVLIKYEWRATLCRMGIVSCASPRPPKNRLWDDGGYAPPPPRRG
jgi:hypothetical protein